MPVVRVTAAAAIAACARIATADVVYGWGYNGQGQLGDGTMSVQPSPVASARFPETTLAVGGVFASVVRGLDGSVWACGSDVFGELGDGPGITSTGSLVRVLNLSNPTSLASGQNHAVAALADGSVWAWGWSFYGQVGDGTTMTRTAPVQVLTSSGVSSVACGQVHSLVLLSDGSVRSWGRNNFGQLGDGTAIDRSSPVMVPSLTSVRVVACGANHSLAVLADGTVRAWGTYGAWLGDAGAGGPGNRKSPVVVAGLSGVSLAPGAVAGGAAQSLAVLADGTVRGWGLNLYGEVGDGTTTTRFTPVVVPGLSNIVAVAAANTSSFALSADGRLWSWGRNYLGSLGLGDQTARLVPSEVTPPPGLRFTSIKASPLADHVIATLGSASSSNGACCAGATCSASSVTACSGPNTRFAGPGVACNVATSLTAPCCRADFNQSGGVSVQDIFDFLVAYFAGGPTADVNQQGGNTVQDIFDYLAAYFAGCP